jgi:hypothetical protein
MGQAQATGRGQRIGGGRSADEVRGYHHGPLREMRVEPTELCDIGQIGRDIAPANKVFLVGRAVAHPMPDSHDQRALFAQWFAIYLASLSQSQSKLRGKKPILFRFRVNQLAVFRV